jgi:hypothetical protein
MAFKLGKLAPKHHLKTLSFEKYLLPEALPAPPGKVFREYKVPEDQWEMFGNDQYGDCTCAAKAHILMLMTAHTGTMVVPTLDDVLTMYEAVCPGFSRVTGANDNGAAITDTLNYLQTTGMAGHKILGWAAVPANNPVRIRQAIYIFGAVDTGFQVPQSALDQTGSGETWDVVPNDGGIQGGHDVPYFGDGSAGYSCVTWAKNQKLTNAFEAQYCDECYCLITEDWLNNADGIAPNMLDLDQLQADLKLIAG